MSRRQDARKELKRQLREDKKKVVKEMRVSLNKLRATRNPKYLFDLLEATIVLQELRLKKL
jgi:hypothetical protein